jgi:hypothetical protein
MKNESAFQQYDCSSRDEHPSTRSLDSVKKQRLTISKIAVNRKSDLPFRHFAKAFIAFKRVAFRCIDQKTGKQQLPQFVYPFS